MTSSPGELQPPYEHLQSIYDHRNDKKVKLTKNSSPDDIKYEQDRRAGQAMLFVLARHKGEDLNRIGLPGPDRMLLCDGAHAADKPCVQCGWGICGSHDESGLGCKNSFKGGFGWATWCRKCDPNPQDPVITPAIIPATPSGKKARGRAKRAKKSGGLGGFGGDSSSASGTEEDEPEEDEPEEEDPNDLWGPIPATTGKTKPRPKAVKKAVVKPSGKKPPAPEKIDLTTIADEKGEGKQDVYLLATQNKGKGLPHDYPADWTHNDPKLSPMDLQLVEVQKGSEEYKQVEEAYRASIVKGHQLVRHSERYNPNYEASYMKQDLKFAPREFKILKLERIQNLPQLRAYHTFKGNLIENMKYHPLNERMKEDDIEETVYHGTSEEFALKIASKGFNRSETSTCAFGSGVYFDVYGQLSQHHATLGRPGEQLTGCVVVTRIATGRLTQTQQSAKDVPDKFDCGASGNNRKAWMRISFSDAQTYAKYLMWIKRIPASV